MAKMTNNYSFQSYLVMTPTTQYVMYHVICENPVFYVRIILKQDRDKITSKFVYVRNLDLLQGPQYLSRISQQSREDQGGIG